MDEHICFPLMNSPSEIAHGGGGLLSTYNVCMYSFPLPLPLAQILVIILPKFWYVKEITVLQLKVLSTSFLLNLFIDWSL